VIEEEKDTPNFLVFGWCLHVCASSITTILIKRRANLIDKTYGTFIRILCLFDRVCAYKICAYKIREYKIYAYLHNHEQCIPADWAGGVHSQDVCLGGKRGELRGQGGG